MGMKSTIEVSERLETLKELQAKQRNIKAGEAYFMSDFIEDQ